MRPVQGSGSNSGERTRRVQVSAPSSSAIAVANWKTLEFCLAKLADSLHPARSDRPAGLDLNGAQDICPSVRRPFPVGDDN